MSLHRYNNNISFSFNGNFQLITIHFEKLSIAQMLFAILLINCIQKNIP